MYPIAACRPKGSQRLIVPPGVLDAVTDVAVNGAWSQWRYLLRGWNGRSRLRVRDTVTSAQADFVTPAQVDAFLGGNTGAIVSLYNQASAGGALAQATTTKQPIYNNNVGPALRAGAVFDAATEALAGANMSAFVTAASGYFIAVCAFSAFTATQQTIVAQPGGYATLSGDGAGKIRALLYDGVSNKTVVAADTIVAGDMFVAEMWWDGASINCRVNGNATASLAAGSMSATGLSRALTVGAYATNYGLNGPFVEGAVMSGRPAAADTIVADFKSANGIP